MKDTLYDVTLTPQQIDCIHGSLYAQHALYKGILRNVKSGEELTKLWMNSEGITEETIQRIFDDVKRMLNDFDHLLEGTPLEDLQGDRVIFREAFQVPIN